MMNGAELILKVGDTATHRDGEVLSALNRRRIMQVHGDMICHVRKSGHATEWGHRPVGSLAQHWFDWTYQYTFLRVGYQEIVRQDNRTGETETFGLMPRYSQRDKSWQAMDVPLFIGRRLAHHGHRIFGEPGQEFWHGGTPIVDLETMNIAWNRITLATGIAPETLRWPAGRMDLRQHLVLPLEHDLSDADFESLIGKRIAWREMLPTSLIRLIDDPKRPVDLRWRGFAASLLTDQRAAA